MISDSDWTRHLYSLQFSEEEYKAWCKQRGFRTSKKKSKNELLAELAQFRKERAVDREIEKNKAAGKENLELNNKLLEIAKQVGKNNKEALADLKLIIKTPVLSFSGYDRYEEQHLKAIVFCLKHKKSWVRDLGTWDCINKNPEKIIVNLVSHLFFKYPVAPFWAKAFLASETEVTWAIKLGRGESFRKITTLPFPISHKEAYSFEKNLDVRYNFKEGFTHALIMAWCENYWIANAAAQSHLSEEYFTPVSKKFWEQFFSLFKYQMFDHYRLRELIDYLLHKRREDPHYSLKNKTLGSIYRQSRDWHAQMREQKQWEGRVNREFKESYPAWSLDLSTAESKGLWTITQLLSDKHLFDEGEAMSHCVFTYGDSCAQGHCSIHSLRKNGDRVATIELRGKVLAQAKLKFNGQLKDEDRLVLEEWLRIEKIKF